jgi:hypothetical protein
MRVNNHKIGFISTHRKIGHYPSITRLDEDTMSTSTPATAQAPPDAKGPPPEAQAPPSNAPPRQAPPVGLVTQAHARELNFIMF